MRIVILLVFAIIMAVIAYNKGFNPLLWIFAGGLIGFLILLFLPSANEDGLDEESILKRKNTGNTTGGIISGLAIVLSLVLIATLANL